MAVAAHLQPLGHTGVSPAMLFAMGAGFPDQRFRAQLEKTYFAAQDLLGMKNPQLSADGHIAILNQALSAHEHYRQWPSNGDLVTRVLRAAQDMPITAHIADDSTPSTKFPILEAPLSLFDVLSKSLPWNINYLCSVRSDLN